MFCNKCGKEVGQNVSFCPNCGSSLNTTNQVPVNNMNNVNNAGNMNNINVPPVNNMNPVSNMNVQPVNNMNYPNQVNNNPNTNKKSKNPIIIILLAIIVVIIGVIIFLLVNKGNDEDMVADSRTVLIYLCGSDLESGMGLATYDISAIDPKKIDLETTNVVIYTGGSKQWHNDFINNNENAIYVLEEEGFVKKETYTKDSMGNTQSLQTLLEYGYDNYKADKMDLIMWNHGLGSLGISSDEQFFGDHLSLNEVTTALKNSDFGSEKKFETVVFRSCLNGTLEMASVFVPYSNYFVASQEITWGGVGSDLLGFINDVTLEDTGADFGKKFIASYESNLDRLAKLSYTTVDDAFPVSTYSIIDLSKLSDLENKLNQFFGDVNLDLNYYSIAKTRSNLYQYGTAGDSLVYDTVDLYTLISELKTLSSSKADAVLKVLDEAIVYNWSNHEESNGLAIYFPYNSSVGYREKHYDGYKNLSGLTDYYTFIKEFDKYQSKASGGGFSVVGKDDIKLSVTNKEATLEINNDDVDEFAKASYTIFTKNTDGTYTPVYVSDTFELAKNKYTVDLNVDLIKAINNEDKSSSILTVRSNIYGKAYTNAILSGDEEVTANIYFNTSDKVSISKVLMTDSENAKGMVLNVSDYDSINFVKKDHSVITNNAVADNWENSYSDNNFQVFDNYSFEKVSVDSNCYVMFKIYDIDNLYVYSNLVQVK